jgi:hypothetical protein
MFSPGSLTNATAEYTLNLSNQRNADANAVDDALAALAICPSCGADTYVERTASGR